MDSGSDEGVVTFPAVLKGLAADAPGVKFELSYDVARRVSTWALVMGPYCDSAGVCSAGPYLAHGM